jgi:site-specific DNA-methyltransferase (adenine-specific)
VIRNENARGLVVRSDCIDLRAHVKDESVDLAYLDPPFSVGVPFGARTKKKEIRARGAKTSGPVAYDDRWPSLDAYIAWLSARIDVVRSVLSSRGTMWLHLDHRAVHEAKITCDEIFGRDAFVGEIIWLPGNGSKARRGPGATHQTILIYARGDDFIWNGNDKSLRAPYAKTSLAMHFTQKDDDGRIFRERTIGKKTYRYYADVGRAIGSVWSDCPAMSANTPLRKETTGYPTQKPLKLLDRIVRASSHANSLVIDPFCGSGTTLEAAARLDRRFVGCDVGTLAIRTSVARLKAIGAQFNHDDVLEDEMEPLTEVATS